MRLISLVLLLCATISTSALAESSADTKDTALKNLSHGFADNNGVKIHYASVGQLPGGCH